MSSCKQRYLLPHWTLEIDCVPRCVPRLGLHLTSDVLYLKCEQHAELVDCPEIQVVTL